MRSFLLALAFSGSLGTQPTCIGKHTRNTDHMVGTQVDCSSLTFLTNKPFCCSSPDTPPYHNHYWSQTDESGIQQTVVGPDTCVALVCDNSDAPSNAASTGGDPVTRFENRETRFWLATDVLTYVFKQLSYTIFYRAGPARATLDLHRRGDWVTEAEVRLGGTFPETIHIEMVDPDLLNRETAFPVLGANLTTIRLSVGDKQLVVGNHSLSAGAVSISAAPLGESSRIGNGFVERVEIKGDGIHVRFTSAKAQKFSDEEKQVKALHLDCEFVKFNRTAARGPLPEMWGLQPLSTETMLLLVPPKIAAQVDGSIIEA